jgi:hypothetical protein
VKSISSPLGTFTQAELLRLSRLAIKDLEFCKLWSDISPPLQMALKIIHEGLGDRGQGVLWKGIDYPIDTTSLGELQSEANLLREGSFIFPGGHHLWNTGGPAALSLGQSSQFKHFLECLCGRPLGEPAINYNYYETPSHRAYPHVDVPESHLNTLLLLRHDSSRFKQSRLILYPYKEDPISIDFFPGELVVFWGGSTVHERTSLAEGELIQVLSVGYSAE